ncbi:hypothetical protein BDN72DRAFT_904325 [Pluteus cervinus]|uniref:Uncharacterized protein n=1 Tax=Pluteus cervinus TaxID=181527 RepID=A0ACD3A6G4_9AGAR|nr:hypothetical protein BDN72DRAFT_904325 [Pluteus cervinus]
MFARKSSPPRRVPDTSGSATSGRPAKPPPKGLPQPAFIHSFTARRTRLRAATPNTSPTAAPRLQSSRQTKKPRLHCWVFIRSYDEIRECFRACATAIQGALDEFLKMIEGLPFQLLKDVLKVLRADEAYMCQTLQLADVLRECLKVIVDLEKCCMTARWEVKQGDKHLDAVSELLVVQGVRLNNTLAEYHGLAVQGLGLLQTVLSQCKVPMAAVNGTFASLANARGDRKDCISPWVCSRCRAHFGRRDTISLRRASLQADTIRTLMLMKNWLRGGHLEI